MLTSRFRLGTTPMVLAAADHAPAHSAGPELRPIVGLDILRFLAAALVMAFHLACTDWVDPNSDVFRLLAGTTAFPDLLPFSRSGWVGVQIFFVISGFVIAFSAQGSGGFHFFRSRFLRLMPGIWICATITFVLALAFSGDPTAVLVARYLRTLIVVPAFRWIDGVYWTLSIEMTFYALVWAMLVRRRLDLLEPVMLGIGLVSAAVWLLAATGRWPLLAVLADKRLAQLLLVTHGCSFALGVLAWRIARAGWTPTRLLGGALCFAGALAQIAASAAVSTRELNLGSPDGLPELLFCAFLLLFGVSVRFNNAVIAGLSPRLVRQIRLLGLATYPLYLLHSFVGALALRGARLLGLPPAMSLALAVLVSMALAILVARHLEPRLRAFSAVLLDAAVAWVAPSRPLRPGAPSVVGSGGTVSS